MLTACRFHKDYQAFLKLHIPTLFRADPNRLSSFSNPLSALWLLNCDPAIPFFIEHYSPKGRPADFDPVDLFRSLVLMAKTGKCFGITEWAQSLRNDRVLAILSGFSPNQLLASAFFMPF